MQESKPPTEKEVSEQKKIMGILKSVTSVRVVLWFIGVGAILAFLSALLTITKFTGHVVYPAWIQLCWDSVNTLLVVLTAAAFLHHPLRKHKSVLKALPEYVLSLAAMAFGIYVGVLTSSPIRMPSLHVSISLG